MDIADLKAQLKSATATQLKYGSVLQYTICNNYSVIVGVFIVHRRWCQKQ